MARISWALSQKLKLNFVRSGLCLLGAAIMLAIRNMPLSFIDRGRLPAASQQVADALGPLDFLLAVPWLGDLSADNPQFSIGLAGFLLLGVPMAVVLGPWARDLFLASFNSDVVAPVTRHVAVDKLTGAQPFLTLAWRLGDGARKRSWDELHEWAQRASGTQGGGLLRRPSFQSMSTAALVGRSGSGKSRMAGELARSLARRDLFGTSGRNRLVQAAGPYLRRIMWFLPRRPGDPWDSGILRHRIGEENFDQYLGRLATWRPRRPTLLILDDPAPDQTGRVHRVLAEASAEFRHAVRLLIVNQTIPGDSLFAFADGEWLYDGAPADPAPIALPEETWFSDREAREVAFASGVLDDKPEAVKTLVRKHLHRITRGNPLLVELALEWIAQHDDLEEVSVDALRRQRIDRIIRALDMSGVNAPSQLGQLALATLVGGASRRRVAQEAASPDLFPALQDLPRQAVLQACFPADPLSNIAGASVVPPIRPPLIGNAFIDHVLAEIGPESAEALVRAAFRIDSARMLRELATPRPANSPLAAAFGALKADSASGIDSLDLALAHADVATFVSLDDPTEWSSTLQDERNARARQAIDRLDASGRAQFIERFALRASGANERLQAAQFQPNVLLALLGHAADPPNLKIDLETWEGLLLALEGKFAPWDVGDPDFASAIRRSAKAVADDFDRADRLLEAVDGLGMGPWHLIDLCEALRPTGRSDLAKVRRHRLAAASAAFNLDHAAYDKRIAALERALAGHDDEAAFQLESIRARRPELALSRSVIHETAARSAAEMLAPILDRFPDSLALHHEAALLWSVVALWYMDGGAPAGRVRAVVDRIRASSSRFPADAKMQRVLAIACVSEAGALAHVPEGAEAAAVEKVAREAAAAADAFPGDVRTQRAAVEALAHAVYARNQVPDGADAERARANADEAARIADRFPSDNVVQTFNATARRYEAFAWAQVPAGGGLEEVRRVVDQVIRITRNFPANPPAQWQAAAAHSYVASSLAALPAGAGAGKIHRPIEEVAAIAARLPTSALIQSELAKVHRNATYAWAGVPGGIEAARVREHRRKVAQIARAFPNHGGMRDELAQALANEASAWSWWDRGVKAEEAEQAATEALALVTPGSEDDFLYRQAAYAWLFAAIAWSNVPAGAAAPKAEAAAAKVHAIADRFWAQPRFQEYSADAYRCEAWAWSERPGGAGAEKCSAAAARAAELARRFPENRDIHYRAALAGKLEAAAWSLAPTSLARTNAAKAAERVRRIVAAASKFAPELKEHWEEAKQHADRAAKWWPSTEG